MNRTKDYSPGIFLILSAVIILALTYSCECPAQTVTPSPIPVPTPADDATAEEVYEYIQGQPDHESWIDCNYDPVVTRRGTCVRVKDEVFQSGDFAVICTHGYTNIYYPNSTDIRGLNHQGYIDIESTVVAFRLMDLFVATVYADNITSDKWEKVKAIKKLHGHQVRPKKPKKEKWKLPNGLKEKKEKFDREVR